MAPTPMPAWTTKNPSPNSIVHYLFGITTGLLLGIMLVLGFYAFSPNYQVTTNVGVIHHLYFGIVFLGFSMPLFVIKRRFASGLLFGVGIILSIDGLYWFHETGLVIMGLLQGLLH